MISVLSEVRIKPRYATLKAVRARYRMRVSEQVWSLLAMPDALSNSAVMMSGWMLSSRITVCTLDQVNEELK